MRETHMKLIAPWLTNVRMHLPIKTIPCSHRGLGNFSQNVRPVVYLTYSSVASGKEFRDSVNFSRRRYHKLGEFVEKPMSREERAKKRRVEE